MTSTTTIYTDRTAWYEAGRPSYPPEVVDVLMELSSTAASGVVADVGAGSGAFSKVLLDRGLAVVAVEPNGAMRSAASALLASYATAAVVAAQAEHLSLRTCSVDAVTVAQALHWFDLDAARREISRVLRPSGAFLAVWNERERSGTEFSDAFERLLVTALPAYALRVVSDPDPVAMVQELLSHRSVIVRRFRHRQRLDERGLLGRVFSNSYAPASGDPLVAVVGSAVRRIFAEHQVAGAVELDYEAIVVAGSFDRAVRQS